MAAKRLFTLGDLTYGQLGDDILGGLGTGYGEQTQSSIASLTGSVTFTGQTVGQSTTLGVTTGNVTYTGNGSNSNTTVGFTTGVINVEGAANGTNGMIGVAIGIEGATGNVNGTNTTTGTALGIVGFNGFGTGSSIAIGQAVGTTPTPPTPAPVTPKLGGRSWYRQLQPQPMQPVALTGRARGGHATRHNVTGQQEITGSTLETHFVSGMVIGVRWPSDAQIRQWLEDELLLMELH